MNIAQKLIFFILISFCYADTNIEVLKNELDVCLRHLSNQGIDDTPIKLDIVPLIQAIATFKFDELSKALKRNYETKLDDLKSELSKVQLNNSSVVSAVPPEANISNDRRARISTLDPVQALDLVSLAGKKYYFSEQMFSWIEANSFCQMYGMELVSIETKEEDELIISELKKLRWAGGTEVFMSGNNIGRGAHKYKWLTGEDIKYSNWHSAAVKFRHGFRCLIYWHAKWADNPCTAERKFICEE